MCAITTTTTCAVTTAIPIVTITQSFTTTETAISCVDSTILSTAESYKCKSLGVQYIKYNIH